MKGLYTILILPVLVTACSMNDIATTNQKISDGASGIMNSLRGNSSGNDEQRMKVSPSEKKESTSKSYTVPVDVDTAAARIKRKFKFISNDELRLIREKNNDGEWTASAITDSNQEWDAMTGSYYKMGSDWGDYDDHLTIELEKNGSGSRIHITYSSSSKQRLASSGLQDLMQNIKNVAEGK
ncbi:hypothetical protein JY494_25140 [Serratia marcescens]|nr:hypothetical protein [Serratia marcescens]